MMRRPGRGLVGAMATTAVVAGTAGAVHHRQEQKWANKEAEQAAAAQQAAATQQVAAQQAQVDQMQAQLQQMQAQEAAAATAAPAASAAAPAGASADVVAQLNQVVQLHTAGVLSDEEFAAAKAKLLG